MIRQVEKVRRKREAGLLPDRDLEILLQGEVKIVDARIPDRGEVARRVPKRLVDVEWTRQIHQVRRWARRWAGPREVECAAVEPVGYCLMETRRQRVADHHRAIR